MKISEALAVYALQLEADGRSANTRRQYERHVGLLVRVLGDVEIGALTHVDLARFLVSAVATHSVDGTPKKATTVNAIRSSLRTFFAWLHAGGFTRANPAGLVRLARCGSSPPRSLSDDEQQRLLDVLASSRGWEAERDRALFGLMLASGIRLASALGLDVEDVDLARSEGVLRRAKGDRVARVLLGTRAREVLRAYIKEGQTGALFGSRQGARLSNRQAQRRFAVWMARAGIEGRSPHSLRHSHAMQLYRRTRDIALVQRALHHASVASTMVYARCDEESLRSALG